MTTLKGHWRLDVYEGDVQHRGDGVVIEKSPLGLDLVRHPIEVIEGDNLVTTTGKGLLLDRLMGVSGAGAAVTQMGVGTDNTAAAVGNTTLTGLVLKVFDSTPTRAGLIVTSISTYGTGDGNIVWAELGSFNAVPTMLNRIAPIGPFTKTTAVSIVVTQTLSQS